MKKIRFREPEPLFRTLYIIFSVLEIIAVAALCAKKLSEMTDALFSDLGIELPKKNEKKRISTKNKDTEHKIADAKKKKHHSSKKKKDDVNLKKLRKAPTLKKAKQVKRCKSTE